MWRSSFYTDFLHDNFHHSDHKLEPQHRVHSYFCLCNDLFLCVCMVETFEGAQVLLFISMLKKPGQVWHVLLFFRKADAAYSASWAAAFCLPECIELRHRTEVQGSPFSVCNLKLPD